MDSNFPSLIRKYSTFRNDLPFLVWQRYFTKASSAPVVIRSRSKCSMKPLCVSQHCYALISRGFQGESEGLTRDDILDNITITWLTNTALSGARLYWEYWGKGYFNAKGVSIPVAVSVFPDNLYPAPRSWTEQAYSKLVY